MSANPITPLDLLKPAATDTPTPDNSPSPDADAASAASAPPSPPATSEPLVGAEGIRDMVTARSETAGDFVAVLDSLALSAGSMRVSLWDVLIVVTVIAALIALAHFGSKLARSLLNRITRLGDAQSVLLDKLMTMAVWALAVLIGIDILGINLTAFAVFSGAFGLAIGFGLQKTFGNLIAGIILLMDKSIKPGDVIAVADQAGNSTFGQIRKIGIRAVSIVTRDQKEYLIPNENLMINQVENWSYSSRNVRMQIPVGVSYQADIRKAEELMLEAARSCDRVLKVPPPTCWLDGYGDSSVNFIIHCWITDPENGTGNVKSEVLKKLWWLLKEHDIEIPFPQRDINLRDNEAFRELIETMRDARVAKPQSDNEQ